MKTMWRCLNPKCADTDKMPGHEFIFEGDEKEVKCPKCGITLKHPGAIARYLHPLVPVHFEPPSAIVEAEGCGEIACKPGEPAKGQRTLEPLAVKCPLCKQSEAYLAAIASRPSAHVIPEGDRQLTINPAVGVTGSAPVSKPEPCNC